MKHLLAIFLMLTHVPVQAETIELEDASLHYTAPAGFARADSLFTPEFAELDQAFGLHTVIAAKYIPEDDVPVRIQDPQAIPSWYIHLAYDKKYSRHILPGWLFSVVSFWIDKNLARQYNKPEFIHKFEIVIGSALQRRFTIESMTQKGFVDIKPTVRSMLTWGRGQVEGDNGRMESYTMGCMISFYLKEGRWITLLQGARLQSEADLPAFTTKALRIASEITREKSRKQ